MVHKGFLQKDFDKLEQVSFCINEQEMSSGMVGTFVFDPVMLELSGTYWAWSGVFDTPDGLFDWLRSKGFTYRCSGKPFCVGRHPC